ncbi:MAG: Alpha-L-arabinofuranosidase precursor, partial [Candidatus Aminicenantes bacterium]|nr:Alpha-L-arabinofuranosidase precursor [Candidatus Aminicenantes bacterium]
SNGIRRNFLLGAAVSAAAVLVGAWLVTAQTPDDTLARGFAAPPDSAKPRVWWHWMSGNVTKEGIKADLEWMKRAGIAGFQNFDAGLDTPQIVEKRLVYMTPEWKEAFKYAAALADELNLEMAIAGSPGWSESGGPWVTPAQAMKKYVWSETRMEGGRRFSGTLPKPPSVTGPYQNMGGRHEGFMEGTKAAPPEFYADSAVVAYRAPESDRPLGELEAKVMSSGGDFNLSSLTDGDLAKAALLPAAPEGGKAWIQLEFSRPQKVQGLTIVTVGRDRRWDANLHALESSDDGREFRTVSAIPIGAGTISFPAVTARFFRLSILTEAGKTASSGGSPQGAPARPEAPAGIQIAELSLHTSAIVNRFQEKAGFDAASGLYALATPAVPAADAVRKSDVIDLTSRMRADGTLDWTPPSGRWVVLRFGYSLTGARNSPASPEATGLEADKLSRAHVKAYFDNYLDQYKATVGDLMGKRGLQYVITDSWEAGVANWTDAMIAEFGNRRGYDMRRWLPVLAGRVVESAEASDRFLWDFRKTIADLTAENHYDQLTDILRGRGMGRYTESHEGGRAFIADGMEVKRNADIPMSAMWVDRPGVPSQGGEADVRESASVAHIYGQNLVAAESLTAYLNAWAYSPETLKSTADRLMAMGLNRFVIHTSVHQPVDDKIPGLGLGPFGQWFTRHETWAEAARPWTTYLSRSCYLLQQGKFAADVLYYYGEDSNITALFPQRLPDIPAGYNFDFVNADALKNRLQAAGGKIMTGTGMSYRLLALDPNSRHMSLGVLQKIRDLVKGGAVVVGPKPTESPSLADNQAEFRAIADGLWNKETGKGKVYGGQTIVQALDALGVAPDFGYTQPRQDTNLRFVHRRLDDGDIYWVSNANNRPEILEASFRIEGKDPELWRADSGVIEPAPYRTENGRTIIPLRLDPNDAVFVVFRKAASAPSRALLVPAETTLASITGAWDVAFQADRGAPAKVSLDALGSWSENPDPGVKYFSGTAIYTKAVQAPAEWFKAGAKLWLDLGDVKNLAEVSVNGKPLGVLWKPPFRIDVTSALQAGDNRLEIKVTNLWVNRLIGDQQLGVTKKYTYTAMPFYKAGSPLLPSGLIGPVLVLLRIREGDV